MRPVYEDRTVELASTRTRAYYGVYWKKVAPDPIGIRVDALSKHDLALLGITAGGTVWVVVHGSPAEAAGIAHQDIVTAIDDEPITDQDSLMASVQRHAPGHVTIQEIRAGKPRTVDVTLGPPLPAR